MKHGFYWIALIFMLACNLMLFYRLIQKRTVNKDLKAYIRNNDMEVQGNYILYESLGASLEEIYLYRDCSKDSISINNLVAEPHLLFRYNIEACTPCIQNVISAIKEVFPNYENNKKIIFSCKGLKPKLNTKFNGKMHYSFTENASMMLPIEKYDIPYLFVLDKDLNLKFLFVVSSKENKQAIIDYLSLVKVKFGL